MVVLKKIKSATLFETLIASVLLVVIFMMASLVLNNLVKTNVTASTLDIQNRINQLEYQYYSGKISLPYSEDINQWVILITEISNNNSSIVEISAKNEAKSLTHVIALKP